ncbi:recombinase family protein [Microvirga soli]|uniref:recombinase family protein n=1 Tax=Microvirga soli TaxID=1854496 RepID=UPI00191D2BD3|nr:recombinase family protein [Microvirga soli]
MEVLDTTATTKIDSADSRPLAFSYLRLSSDKQKKGDGYRRQMEDTELYCEKMGLHLDHQLEDIGVSGWTGANVTKKAALGQFLEMTKDKPGKPRSIPRGSHLVVESLDRISRDKVMKAFRIFTEILEAGITLHTFGDNKIYTEESVNENTSDLIISITIMIRANNESTMKARRQRKTWEQKRKDASNEKLSARCPTWLKLLPDRKTFEPLPERVKLVERMFMMSADGWGCDSIARTFNRENVKPFSHGRSWHGGTVRAYLQSKAVLGHYQPNRTMRVRVVDEETGEPELKVQRVPEGDVITDYYPQIITDEQWHRTWDAIGSRSLGKAMNPQGRKGSKLTNLFSGFGRCVYCGSPMNVRNRGESTRHKHKPFLMCSNSRNGICPNNRQYTLPPLEEAVLEFVQEIDLSEPQSIGAQVLEQQMASKRTKADDLQSFIDNLMPSVERGSKSAQKQLEVREAELEIVEQEIAAIRCQLESMKAAVPLADRQAAMKELRQKVATANDAELFAIRTGLRQTLREIITFMTFMRDGSVAVAVKGMEIGYIFKDGKMIKRMEDLKPAA